MCPFRRLKQSAKSSFLPWTCFLKYLCINKIPATKDIIHICPQRVFYKFSKITSDHPDDCRFMFEIKAKISHYLIILFEYILK